jgi:peptidoglycan-associated lipoprotein
MKKGSLALLGLAFITISACSKKAPVAASRPPDTTPVSQPAPPPQQMQQRTSTPPPQQASAPAPAQRNDVMPPEVRRTLNERLARLSDALFDYDKATIRPDALNALKDDVAVIRDILHDYPSQKLIIEGHCDERGSEEYNMALGDRRAAASKEFLSSMGIPTVQLSVISYGKDRPVCTDKTEDCWQKNRRAHVTAAP